MSVYKAARMYGIPETTLRDRKLGNQPVSDVPSYGHPPLFTQAEEKQLAEHIVYMARIGYGYTRAKFLRLATDWAVCLGRKQATDQAFSPSWFSGFRRRNPNVTLAKPQKLSILRAKATSETTLSRYFEELSAVFTKYDFAEHPEYIWNIDETGLMMEHNPRRVMCEKGSTPQAITSNRGKTVTIIACGSASGNRLPPYYIFPGKRWIPDLLTGATPGAAGTVTESGWSNSLVFIEYLEKHFLAHVSTKEHPVIILFDGHKSHVNLTLSAWVEKNNVVFFVLPPHTSHITQPLDVGCFGPLKNVYHSECQSYMRRNPGIQITRYNIAEISGIAYNKGVSPDNLVGAFRKTGMGQMAIEDVKTAPSVIYIDETGDHMPDHDIETAKSFFDSRKIVKVSVAPRKRKTVTIMGDLSSPSKKRLLTPTCSGKPKTTAVATSPLPGPSGITTTQQPPNRVQLYSDTESDTDTEETPESDLCCVCKRLDPDALHLDMGLKIVSWGQCDQCNHWVHLKFCSIVRVIRRNDTFLCPCCN